MSFPSTMKAITIAKNGGPEVIEETQQQFPKITASNVVIKVHYAGVNFIDTYVRSGLYPTKEFPLIVGKELSGTVVGLPTDKIVLDDPEYQKRGFKSGDHVVSIVPSGALADYVSADWSSTFVIPSNVSVRDAAAGLLQGLTCVAFMDESYDVQKGDTVLVHTAAGGMGLLMCQYALSCGATVIGTTSTEDKKALVVKHGVPAENVILYTKEDTVERVLQITNGAGVRVIYDGVGKDTFENDFKMIQRKGTLVSFGNASGAVPPFAPFKLTDKNVKFCRPTVMNYLTTPPESFHWSSKVCNLIADGTLRINIHNDYPFTAEGVANAQKDLVGGKTTGKLIVKVSD